MSDAKRLIEMAEMVEEHAEDEEAQAGAGGPLAECTGSDAAYMATSYRLAASVLREAAKARAA